MRRFILLVAAVAACAALAVPMAEAKSKPRTPPPPADQSKPEATIPAEWGRVVSSTVSYSIVGEVSGVTLVMEAPDGTVRVVSLVYDNVVVLARWDRAPAASLAPVLPPQ